jgi:hypothetical protein
VCRFVPPAQVYVHTGGDVFIQQNKFVHAVHVVQGRVCFVSSTTQLPNTNKMLWGTNFPHNNPNRLLAAKTLLGTSCDCLTCSVTLNVWYINGLGCSFKQQQGCIPTHQCIATTKTAWVAVSSSSKAAFPLINASQQLNTLRWNPNHKMVFEAPCLVHNI